MKNIKDGWDNIQSLQIKTNSSISLPIWTCELGGAKGGRWDGLVKSEDASVESEPEGGSDSDEDGMSSEEHVPVVPAGKGKGTKRLLNEDVEKPVTPKEVKEKWNAEGGQKKKTKIVGADMSLEEHVPVVLASKGKGTKRLLSEDVDKPISPKEVTPKRSAEGGHKKKAKIVKKKANIVEADMGSEERVPAVPVDKSKDSKKLLNVDVEKPITPKEVKQKRSAEGGEKKKAKIVNSGPTKSAKAVLIGKKPGRP